MLFGADFYEVVYEVGELSWLVFADDDVLLFHDGMTDEVEFEEFACEVGAADLHLLVLFYGECDQVAHRAFEFASRTGEEAVFRYGDFDFHVEVGSDRIGHFAIEFACLAVRIAEEHGLEAQDTLHRSVRKHLPKALGPVPPLGEVGVIEDKATGSIFGICPAADKADQLAVDGMDVQLFFYKKGNGSWNALITTDMGIDAKRAFELYARRWCIEVAHKEMKGLLNLGKCQCVDFAGQVAALSLCMIQYNILGTVKRFESYETIGGLFAEITGETVELTVVQRIWGLIIEVINVIAEFLSCDPFELTENVINNNHQIKAVKMAFDRLDLAGAAA